MATWLKTFTFKDLLGDEDATPEEANRLGKEMANRLREQLPFPSSLNEAIAVAFELTYDQDDFNETLAWLYDEADTARVWCGIA